MKIFFTYYFYFLFDLVTSSNQYCGSFLPKDLSSCEPYTTDSAYCCYLSSYTNNLNFHMCYPINKTDYLGLHNTLDINGYNFKVDCGLHVGTTCGAVSKPISYKDCGQFSTGSNSCCYYKYKNETSCVWLESSDIGEVNYKGLQVICGGMWIKLRYSVIYILISLFIL
jgi:hypothetical protein